jgi:hypothetical protein
MSLGIFVVTGLVFSVSQLQETWQHEKLISGNSASQEKHSLTVDSCWISFIFSNAEDAGQVSSLAYMKAAVVSY